MTEPRKTTEAARRLGRYERLRHEYEVLVRGDAYAEAFEGPRAPRHLIDEAWSQIETAIREQERQRYSELVAAARQVAAAVQAFDADSNWETENELINSERALVQAVAALAAIEQEGRPHDE